MGTNAAYRGLSLEEAFSRSTDGEECPLNQAWTVEGFLTLCEASGFSARHLGNAVSLHELTMLPRRFEPMQDPKFPAEHRRFLATLEFDRFGIPYHGGVVAGIDGCYEAVKKPGVTVDFEQVSLIEKLQKRQIQLKALQSELRDAERLRS
jgi:hypothetical protein